jgi:PAS domain S-box-containing protein/putative nucleotidyltransferase with HDIG domain
LNAVRQFFQNLNASNISTGTLREKGLEYWRERIYTYTLATMAVLGFVDLVPSVFLSFTSGFVILGSFDILAYLYVLVLLFVRPFSYRFRVAQLLVLGILVGVTVFYFTGDEGGGMLWLFMVPPLASLLLGLRWGSVLLGVNVVIVFITGYLIVIESPLLPTLSEFTLENWIIFSVNFLVTNTLVTIPLGALLQGLLASTEREKQTEFSRANMATQLSLVYDNVADIIFFLAVESDGGFRFLSVNPAFYRVTGLSQDQVVGKLVQEVIPSPAQELVLGKYKEAIREKRTARWEETSVYPAGTKQGEVSVTPIFDAQGRCNHLVGAVHDITERKQTDAEIRKLYERYRKLFANMLNGYAYCQMLFDENNQPIDFIYLEVNDAFVGLTGLKSIVGKNVTEAIPGIKESNPELFEIYGRVAMTGKPEMFETYVDPLKIWFSISVYCPEKGFFIAVFDNITERKEADEQMRRRLAELEAIGKVSTALRAAESVKEILPPLLDTTLEVLNLQRGSIWLYDKADDLVKLAFSRGFTNPERVPPETPGTGLAGFVFASGQPLLSRELSSDPRVPEQVRLRIPAGVGGASVPLKSEDNPIGVLAINTFLPAELSPSEVSLLATLAELGGTAIQRTMLHQQTEQRLQTLIALADIDRAILSSFDLQTNLRVIVDRMVSHLRIDAGNIMLYDADFQTLKSVYGQGFHTHAFEGGELRLGEGNAGRAAQDQVIVHLSRLDEQVNNPRLAKAQVGENFVSYYAVPLIAKGKVQGVLEAFLRTPFEGDADWVRTLETFAGQAAIAIDTIGAFEDLQKSNAELVLSYNAAIEGWSRALDLRDKETEGHTQRVTDLGVQLAHNLGMRDKDLVHFRRGSLLHDIGKMGIPDNILLKPGKLTEEERAIMKLHPTHAREMLENISFLQKALDIPYNHHEKWDGSGYPRGLSGAEIPSAARIFAVVDVYDALTSDRPYRKAWSKKKALDYILEQSGKYFDPNVVETFLNLELP